MSAVQALEPLARIATRADRARRRLSLIEAAPRKVSRFPFLLALVALLAVGMGGLVVVNTQIQTQATELAGLQREAANLSHKQAQTQAEVDNLRSPASLQAKAYELGMRPNPQPAFIVLPEGKILGTPTKVTGKELPDQVYLTWQQQVQQQEAARLAVVKAKADAAAKKAAEDKLKAEQAAAKKKAAEDAAAKKAADEATAKKQQDAQKQQSTAPSTKPTGGN
ncbi:hypothetical protein ACQB6R_05285 [Propionibacteriaceae bacterium G1746]